MKKLLWIGTFFLFSSFGCKAPMRMPKEAQSQEKYLFKELIDSSLYLGMSKKEFLSARPNASYNSDAFEFRSIYVEEHFSERFPTIIYYLDNDEQQPLYEFILLLESETVANEIAIEHFGLPNHKHKEWRFPPAQTNLPYTIAAWTHKNKIIIAATITGTEWETGID